MVYWNRFISYIYRYHDGHKCENSGFAKVAKVGRTGRLTVGLRNGMNSRRRWPTKAQWAVNRQMNP